MVATRAGRLRGWAPVSDHVIKQRGEERFREEGEMAQKNGEEGERTQKIGRRENQHEKGEGRMS